MKAESNVIILLHAIKKCFSFSLRNVETCCIGLLKWSPIILSTIVRVLNSSNPKSVHSTEVTGVVLSILRDFAKQQPVFLFESSCMTNLICWHAPFSLESSY